MKSWMKLSVVFAVCAFVICSLSGNRTFATESSTLAQQNQIAPSRGQSKQFPPSIPPTSQQPPAPPTPPPSRHIPPVSPAPGPGNMPTPPTNIPVVPPSGMTMCIFTNSNGIQVAIIVPIGTTCVLNADGSVTLTFPGVGQSTYTVPAYASEGVFYTANGEPVIVVPYYNSTVTLDPIAYRITLPDGRVYLLTIPNLGKDPFYWFYPHAPLPIYTPVVPPPDTATCIFTNSDGVQIMIIAPYGSRCITNNDGSFTVFFPDGTRHTFPADSTNLSFTSKEGWHVIIVPYLGSTITNYGPIGFLITLPDGSTRWDNYFYPH